MDLYAVQRAVPARKQSKKHNQKQKKPSKPKTHNHNQTKTRYPEGGTSRAPSRRQRTNRGSGQSRGGNGARRERAKPKQPHTLKAKPSSNRGRDKNKKANRNPRHHKQKTTQKAQRPKDTGRKRTTRAGRGKQAARYGPPSTPPGERKQTERNQENIRPISQSLRQEARRNATTKRNELRSTSAPAQSADRHTSTKGGKIYLCGGRTEANVRMYLSSLWGCTQALLAIPLLCVFVLYFRRPGCHACGKVCCDGLAPVFTSPHGNKGFGPVWGSALYTMLRVLFGALPSVCGLCSCLLWLVCSFRIVLDLWAVLVASLLR